MQYLGGKTNLSKPIARIIHSREGSFRRYVEPFLGGGSCFTAISPYFNEQTPIANDAHQELMMMWRAVAKDSWTPPVSITREDYYRVKRGEPGALRGFVGFSCSHLGKWWGGFAHSNTEHIDYATSGSKLVRERAEGMKTADLRCGPYWLLSQELTENDIVYCDPPYFGTEKYPTGSGRAFDHERFWRIMSNWAKFGVRVYVSEFSAPKDWVSIWDKVRVNRGSCFNDFQSTSREHLFVYRGYER